MDLPSTLEKEEFVDGYEELKQTIIQVLTVEKKGFMQSASRGCVGIIHSSMSYIAIESYVREACEQVNGVVVTSVEVAEVEDGILVKVLMDYNKTKVMVIYDSGIWR